MNTMAAIVQKFKLNYIECIPGVHNGHKSALVRV